MGFIGWLRLQGCNVEITQEDDGSGYVVVYVTTPDEMTYTMSVDV